MYISVNNTKIKIIKETNIFKKIKGLIGIKNINYGLLIPKCNAIHTYFMKDNIDVLFLDKDNTILLKYINMPKNKTIGIKNNHKKTSVLELPKNTSFNLNIGDKLAFESE